MRVLHIDTGREMRGGQWQMLALARGLRGRGIEQRLLARGPLLERLGEEGFCPDDASPSAVRRAVSGVNLVHAHDARGHTLAALWRAAGRPPLLVSRRVAFPVKPGWLSRWKYARADRFLAVSGFVAGRLGEAGIDRSRVRVVYDGVEDPGFRPYAPGGVLLSPFFDDSRKGSVILEESGLAVRFSRDLAADLAGAKVFVYLSYEEGLGSAVLLAQAAGVPVVASRVGGLTEIVRHEETGLLVDNTVEAVRTAVSRLDADPALAVRLAANARRQYEAGFRVEHMVAATLAAYRELVPEPGA